MHADAIDAGATAWDQIVTLYDQLLTIRPNAVVALNRAVAVGERDGPDAGLLALDAIDSTAVDGYAPFHATRADLAARTGRTAAARAAYDRAIALTTNEAERAFLDRQRAALPDDASVTE